MQSEELLKQLRAGQMDITNLDVYFAYRLLLGRQPEFTSLESYVARRGTSPVKDFVLEFLASEEFSNVWSDLPALHRTGDLMIRTDLPNGIVLNFFARDWAIGWHIAMRNFERVTEDVIRTYVTPNCVSLDIGSNIGYFTMLMAKLGAKKVYALEPFAAVFGILLRNIKDNELTNVIAVQKAADQDSQTRVRIHYEEAGFNTGSSFIPACEDSAIALKHPYVEVETITADNLIPSSERVAFVKLDVEGSELKALRGMTRILSQDRPVLLVECNPFCLKTMAGVTPEALVSELRGHRYRLLTEQQEEFVLDRSDTVRNILCLPE
ncbi:MAG: FkbM family methyltransferase [Bryobacteraceae bacterium]